MELKSYQRTVLENLEEYLHYVQKYDHFGTAFNQYWEDKIGPYNPVNGTGMPLKIIFPMLFMSVSSATKAEKPLLYMPCIHLFRIRFTQTESGHLVGALEQFATANC